MQSIVKFCSQAQTASRRIEADLVPWEITLGWHLWDNLGEGNHFNFHFISYFLSSDDKCRFRLPCLINFIPHWLSLTWVIVGVISEGWKLVVVVTVGDINHGYLCHHWLWRRHGGHPWHPPAISLSILLMSVVCRLPIILRFQLSANLVSRKRFSN